MNEWDELRNILELSIKKNGNQPLTVQHLLNIMKMIDKKISEENDDLYKLGWDCIDLNS